MSSTVKKRSIKPAYISRALHLLIILSVIYCLGCTASYKQQKGAPLGSGERIAAGGGGQPAPIAPGLQSSPVGRTFAFNHAEPDLFDVANRHDPGPGLYLYEWTGRNNEGILFAPPRKATLSFIDHTSAGFHDTGPEVSRFIFQKDNRQIHGWWLIGSEIYRTIYDKDELQFKLSDAGRINMTGLPDAPEIPSTLAVLQTTDSTLQIIEAVNDGLKHRPEGYWRHPDYIMYNGAGTFTGKWPYEYLYISDTISINVCSPVRLHQ